MFTNNRLANIIPSLECYNVFQDSDGFIWFGTEAGLCKYDGLSLEVFNNNGFPEKACYGICETSNHKLWLLTSKNRILFYDKIKNSFIEMPFSKALKKQSYINSTDQLYFIQSYNDSSIIVCTQWKTFQINIYTGTIQKLEAEKNDSYDFYYSKQSLFPVKTDMTKTNKIAERDYPIKITIRGKINATGHVNWEKGTYPQYRCLTTLNKQGDGFIGWDNKLIKISSSGKTEDYKIPGDVLALYCDKDDGIWVGTYKAGVFYFKNGTLSNPINSLNGFSVTGICEDHEKGIWCSTLEKGVFYSNDKRVISYENLYGIDKSEELLKSFDKSIYCFANNKTVLKISNNNIQTYDLSIKCNYGINDLITYRDGYIIANHKCVAYATKDFKIRKYYKIKGQPFIIGAKRISISPSGRIFMVQSGAIIELVNNDHLEKNFENIKSLANCIVADTNELWLGCKDGLLKVNINNYQYEKVKEISGSVADLLKTKNEDLWIATKDNGIFLLRNNSFRNLSKGNKVLNNARYFGLCSDSIGNIWVASNIGLIKINEQDPAKFNIYSTKNGLPSNQIIKVAISQKKVFISTTDGLCSIPLDEDITNHTPPPVFLKKIHLDEKEIPASDTIVLSYNYKFFNMDFIPLTFKTNDEPGLIYKLTDKNNNTTWTDTISGSIINFNHLPSGKYQLLVFAVNNDGIVSKKPASFFIFVQKAFWQNWWFYSLLLLLLVLFIYAIVKILAYRIKKAEESKTRINKMLAEYQLSALQAQMNPHFIFNAINSIQSYILKKDKQEAYDYLAKFSKLIRMVLNNSKENLISLKQELELLQLYIDLEQLRFDNSFVFRLKVDDNVNPYEIQVPTMLLQPYVENAIWHGLMNLEKNKQGVLNIYIGKENNILKIIVEDNGVGRELSKTFHQQLQNHQSAGMNITEQRLLTINKMLDYECAKVIITDLHDSSGNASGTKVEIYFAIEYNETNY